MFKLIIILATGPGLAGIPVDGSTYNPNFYYSLETCNIAGQKAADNLHKKIYVNWTCVPVEDRDNKLK